MKYRLKIHLFIVLVSLCPLLVSGCFGEDPYCFNLCMDGMFLENFGGVVRDEHTREDISGAVVYLYESANQRCEPCTNLPDLRLVTDESGRFRLPDNIVLEQTYLVDVFIFADGCEPYHETVTASSLGTSDDWETNQPILILSYFELICTPDMLTPIP